MRSAAIRNVVSAPSARLATRPVPRAFHSPARVSASRQAFRTGARGYANGVGEQPNALQSQGLVLGALGLIAVGGYFYLKPIRDVAATINTTMESAKQTVDQAKEKAKNVASTAADVGGSAVDTAKNVADAAGIDAGNSMDGLLKALLPGGAYMIYNQFSGALKGGDFGGMLSKLGDADIQGSLDQLKKLGGEDVKRVVEKVQVAVDKANGKVENVDWKKLAQDLTNELPKEYQQWVHFLVGKVPSADDFNKYVEDAKSLGKDKLKDLNDAAESIYKKVEKASKDGKNVGDAFVEGVKESSPEEINKFVDSLKKTAKDAGLPADAIESWVRSQAVDSIDSAQEWAKDIEGKINTAIKWSPVEPEDIVKSVTAVSPSLGKLLDELLKDAKNKAEQGKKAIDQGAEKAKKEIKK